MHQLKFDNFFQKIEKEPLNIWNNREDIPEKIIDYFDRLPQRLLIDSTNSYCPICLKKINDYCDHCHKKYDKDYYCYIDDIKNIKDYFYNDFFFAFDTFNDEVIFYVLKKNIYYNNPLISVPYFTTKYSVYRAFQLSKNGISDILNKKVKMSYKDMHERLLIEEEMYILMYDLFEEQDNYFLYTDNLNKLKNSIYKYTKIWDAKEYLEKHPVCILNLIYAPLYNQDFEFLIKNKLYNLAFSQYYLESFNDFKTIYKNNKEFIIHNNLDYYELKALQLVKINDMEVIKLVAENLDLVRDIIKIANIDFMKLKNIVNDNIYEYYDYICMAKKLGFNLKDKNVLYPKDFIKEHNKLYKQITLINEPDIDKNIKKIAKKLAVNKYEDNRYVIYPAPSIDSLIEEGSMQNNCVRTYSKIYSQNKTHIYFMRKKSNLKKSFVTIEVKNNKIKQARIKNNELPNENIEKILKNWEKTLKKKK